MQIIEQFKSYIKSFDITDPAISNKWNHSLRVAFRAYDIAEELGLDQRNINIAFYIGLFHDYARFEQRAWFKTFADTLSVDHGDYACELLFKKGHIYSYDIPEKWYPVFDFAIRNHNKYKIDETKLPLIKIDRNCPPDFNVDVLLHAKILRDADKLDILKNKVQILESIHCKDAAYNSRTPHGITTEALQQIKDKQVIQSRNVKTTPDSILQSFSFAYDIYTEPAKRMFIKANYPLNIYRVLENQFDPADTKTIQRAAEQVMRDLQKSVSETTKQR